MFKKIAMLLCLIALCLGLATMAGAENETGTYEENLSWTLSDESTLTISGAGAITDFFGDGATEKFAATISDGVLTITGEGEMPDLESPRSDVISGIKSIVISDGTTSIGDYALSCCCYDPDFNNLNRDLVSVTIPDSVTSIGKGAFHSCDLASITIPDSVTSIGDAAFFWCITLTNITIPDSVESIGSGAFNLCENLTSVIIPEKITTIERQTFYGCKSLKHVSIPEGVTTIGSEAFSGCTSLESITIPETLETIEENAFSGCTRLTDIYYTGDKSQFETTITVKDGNDAFKKAAVTYNYFDIYPQVQTILNYLLDNAVLTEKTTEKVNANADSNIDVGDIQTLYNKFKAISSQ